MKKISLILVFALLMTSLGAAVYGEEIITEPELVGNSSTVVTDIEKNMEIYNANKEVFDLIEGLGISDITNYSANIKRHEFISAVVNLFKLNIDDNAAVNFFDIDKESSYCTDMMAAYQANLIKEDASGKLNPEKVITYNEAVKIVVCAMGGMSVAESMGGYPVGYTRLADNWKITKNVNANDFNYAEAAQLLYNVLRTGTVESFVTNGGVQFTYGDEENVEDLYGLRRYEGIVTSNSMTLTLAEKDGENKIEIDGKIYSLNLLNDVDENAILGCKVYYYANIVDGAVYDIAIIGSIDDRMTVVEVSDEDIMPATTLRVFQYYDEKDNEKKMNISDDARFFYNRVRSYDMERADLMPNPGTVRLIDNDGDKQADFVFVETYTYMVVARSSTERIVSMYDNSDVIELDDDIAFYKNGFKIPSDNIAEWDVLKIMSAKNGKICAVDVFSNEVSGTIEKISKKDGVTKVTIGGVEFELSNIYIDAYESHHIKAREPKVKQRYTFVIDDDNMIFGTRLSSTNEFEYGFLAAVSDGKGLDKDPQFKIYTMLGKMQIFDANENLKINDAKLTGTASSVFADQYGKFKSQLIMYKVDGDGKIKEIKKAVDARKSTGGAGFDLENFSLDDDVIGPAAWSGANSLSTIQNYRVETVGVTPMFFVPADRSDDDSYVYYPAYSNLQIFNTATTDIEIFDLQPYVAGHEYYKVSAIVVYEEVDELGNKNPYAMDAISAKGQPAGTYVVNEICEELDSEGNPVYVLNSTNLGDLTEFIAYIDPEAKNVDIANDYGFGGRTVTDIKIGDIVQVAYKNPYVSNPIVDKFVIQSSADWYADPNFFRIVQYNNYDAIELDIARRSLMYAEVVYIDDVNFILISEDNYGNDKYIGVFSGGSPYTFDYSVSDEKIERSSFSLVGAGDKVLIEGRMDTWGPSYVIRVVE